MRLAKTAATGLPDQSALYVPTSIPPGAVAARASHLGRFVGDARDFEILNGAALKLGFHREALLALLVEREHQILRINECRPRHPRGLHMGRRQVHLLHPPFALRASTSTRTGELIQYA